jgi:hypothetical protein
MHLVEQVIVRLNDRALRDHALQSAPLLLDASPSFLDLLVDCDWGLGSRHGQLSWRSAATTVWRRLGSIVWNRCLGTKLKVFRFPADQKLSARSHVQVLYELAPVIADVISSHCHGTCAREDFVRACVSGEWEDAKVMVEGMLAEPWHLTGYQEKRLHEFLALLQLNQGVLVPQ